MYRFNHGGQLHNTSQLKKETWTLCLPFTTGPMIQLKVKSQVTVLVTVFDIFYVLRMHIYWNKA